MKKFIGIALLLIIILFLALGIMRKGQKEEVLSIAKIQAVEGIPVFSHTVGLDDIKVVRRYYGNIRAANQTVVTSKIMERIDNIYVEVGDQVKKGQVLVDFDISASQVQINTTRIALENAQKELDRMDALLKTGAVSKQAYDMVKLQFDIASENYRLAQNTIELEAPISGIVSRIDFVEGAVAFPGDVIVSIIDPDKYEAVFEVTQGDRELIKKGQAVKISYNGGSITNGKISRISHQTTEGGRMFKIYADIQGSEDLYAGIMAIVDVTINHKENVLSIPIEAVLERNDQKNAVLINNGIARIQNLQTGIQSETKVEIVNGLKAGDIVATYGHSEVEDGQKIKIVKDNH